MKKYLSYAFFLINFLVCLNISNGEDNQLIRTLGMGQVHMIAVDPSGEKFASAGSSGYVYLWDKVAGKVTDTLTCSPSEVTSLEYCKDGSKIAVGHQDGSFRLWDTGTGKQLYSNTSDSQKIVTITFSPDDRYIAFGGADKHIKVLNTNDNTIYSTFHGSDRWVYMVTFSDDGKYLVGSWGDYTIIIFDIESKNAIASFVGTTQYFSLSPDGKKIATGKTIYDVNTKEVLYQFDEARYFLIFSPDGSKVAYDDNKNAINVWDLETNSLFRSYKEHTSIIRGMKFNHDGKILASYGNDSLIIIYNLVSNTITHLNELKSRIISILFTPDDTELLSSSYDTYIKLWNADNGEIKKVFSGHKDLMLSVEISSDNSKLISRTQDKSFIFDIGSGELINELSATSNEPDQVPTFSHDGSRLANGTNDGMIELWDVNFDTLIYSVKGHTQRISSIDFSHDNSFFASGSYDGTIRIWNVPGIRYSGKTEELIVFPSPANKFINIRVINFKEFNSDMEYEIFNSTGQTEITDNIKILPGGYVSDKINISLLPIGVYFVRVGDIVRKFVKI